MLNAKEFTQQFNVRMYSFHALVYFYNRMKISIYMFKHTQVFIKQAGAWIYKKEISSW
jgi:hypothetical protein